MSNPIVADNKPIKVNLTKGQEYYFCTCGRSKGQPFCDGSHAGTSFTPKAMVSEQDQEAYLCVCKHTRNAPFCDGSHKQFSNDDIGHEGPGVMDDDSLIPAVQATAEEPTVEFIHQLAREGLSKVGRHGPMSAMGVPRSKLPSWDDIQIMVAQLARKPLLDEDPVETRLVIGPEAKKPLTLDIPLFVSDMSFGALSEEAKIALSKGA
ncbi:MAG: CDGSH iron-sulfur domain-containing protein, partial [Porticoccus sp.]|nr:CDGSH iron-sulfur domain-containing protein [Porticoccus sp.]